VRHRSISAQEEEEEEEEPHALVVKVGRATEITVVSEMVERLRSLEVLALLRSHAATAPLSTAPPGMRTHCTRAPALPHSPRRHLPRVCCGHAPPIGPAALACAQIVRCGTGTVTRTDVLVANKERASIVCLNARANQSVARCVAARRSVVSHGARIAGVGWRAINYRISGWQRRTV
jgi:hypothetical protein